MLVEAGRDGSEVFDTVEEPLDLVAHSVDASTECRFLDPVIERPNVGECTLCRDLFAKRIAIVAAISEHDAVLRQVFQHAGATRPIVGLALGQLQRDREAAGVDERMDLGRKPAAGASHATISSTFFSLFAAC